MTISDQDFIKAIEIYLQVRGNISRLEFINELKELAEQVAPDRFESLLLKISQPAKQEAA